MTDTTSASHKRLGVMRLAAFVPHCRSIVRQFISSNSLPRRDAARFAARAGASLRRLRRTWEPDAFRHVTSRLWNGLRFFQR